MTRKLIKKKSGKKMSVAQKVYKTVVIAKEELEKISVREDELDNIVSSMPAFENDCVEIRCYIDGTDVDFSIEWCKKGMPTPEQVNEMIDFLKKNYT
jgi:hypothetical protein